MKSYIVLLFGCLAFVSLAYSWSVTAYDDDPGLRECVYYKDQIDTSAIKILCLSDIVADISLTGNGTKVRFNKVYIGNKRLNGVELVAKYRNSGCEDLLSKEKLCLVVDNYLLDDKSIYLNDNTMVVGAECKFKFETHSCNPNVTLIGEVDVV